MSRLHHTKIKSIACVFLIIVQLGLLGCQRVETSNFSGGNLGEPPDYTDKLVIYAGPMMLQFMQQAKRIYNERFPDVDVEFHEFGDYMTEVRPGYLVTNQEAQDNFEEALTTALTVGAGPDLVVFQSEFDLFKLSQTGQFYNIDVFLAQDEGFDLNAYNRMVLDSGIYRGERLTVPLDYHLTLLVSTKEALQTAGLILSDQPTYQEFWNQLKRFLQKDSQQQLCSLEQSPNNWIANCGVQLFDFDTGELKIDHDSFHDMLQNCKMIYQNDSETSREDRILSVSGADVQAVQNGELLFILAHNDYFIPYRGLAGIETPICFPIPNINGDDPVAHVGFQAAIRSNSDNKANAYEFLKILLSEPIQSMDLSFLGLPVLQDAFYRRLNQKSNFTEIPMGFDGSLSAVAMTQEQIDFFAHIFSHVDCSKEYSKEVYTILNQIMEPYYQDQKSYEECVALLKQQLEIYINE